MRVKLITDCKVNNFMRPKHTVLDVPLAQARALIYSKNAVTVCSQDADIVSAGDLYTETTPENTAPVAESVTTNSTEGADSDV